MTELNYRADDLATFARHAAYRELLADGVAESRAREIVGQLEIRVRPEG